MENYSLKIINNMHNVSCVIMIAAILILLIALIIYCISKCDNLDGFDRSTELELSKKILLISGIITTITMLIYIFTF